MSPQLAKLQEAVRLAGELGGEVLLPTKAALAVMDSAGLRLWDDLGTAAQVDHCYDTTIGMFRLTPLP